MMNHQKATRPLLIKMIMQNWIPLKFEGDMAAKYLTMVGQLQWLVTLGRFDLHAQIATKSRSRAA